MREVDLWLLSTVVPDVSPYAALLSVAERERAARFKFDRDRDAFTVAHGLARLVLADYAGIDPADLEFVDDASGKPSLRGAGDLSFNLSHSGGRLLVGVAFGMALGVDVEVIRPVPERDAIMAGNGTWLERQAFDALPTAERDAAFFAWWTRKEALLKARGDGLSVPLDSFEVPVQPTDFRMEMADRAGPFTLWSRRQGDCWIALATIASAGDIRLRTRLEPRT